MTVVEQKKCKMIYNKKSITCKENIMMINPPPLYILAIFLLWFVVKAIVFYFNLLNH